MADRRPLPLVTVIATCFNHERYVIECLESIRAQTYPNVQLIVADDASTDRSVELIREWARGTGTTCTFVFHEENQGVCRTRNDTLALAEGAYVSGISTDDVWRPDKLAAQVAQMEALPATVGVAYGDAERMDADGKPLPGMFIEQTGVVRTPPEGNIYEILLEQNFIPAMSTLVRRECFETVGPYDESLVYEDKDMWLRIARRYEFVFTPRVAVRYRVHPASLSHTMSGGRNGAAWWEADIAIYLKHIGYSRAWDAVLWDRIARAAYRLDRPEQLEYARANLRAGRSARALVLYVLCRVGVPYRRLGRLKRSAGALVARYAGKAEGRKRKPRVSSASGAPRTSERSPKTSSRTSSSPESDAAARSSSRLKTQLRNSVSKP
jgi:glycosyltransferase involved in cell wall biosynthesis